MNFTKSVCIYVPTVAQYRISFYERLRDLLRNSNIDLFLVVDENNSTSRFNGDLTSTDLKIVKTRRLKVCILGFNFVLGFGISNIIRSDLIIIQGSAGTIDNWLIIIVAKILRKRILIWTLHWEKEGRKKSLVRLKWMVVNFFHQLADGLICYNSRTQKYYKTAAPKVQSVIAHNGIELNDYRRPGVVQWSKRRRETLSCLYIGGLSENKNVVNLIEAFEHDELKNINLLIAGTGDLSSKVTRVARERKNINYLGEIQGTRKQDAFENSDLCIMPGEGGLFMLEANYFKKPVLFYAGDGCEDDYLIDNLNCIKLADQSVASIVAAVTKFARSPFTHEINNTWPLQVANTGVMAKVFFEFIEKNLPK